MIFFEHHADTVYLKHFYHSSFTGDAIKEQLRKKKVAAVIKQMGDRYVLANPVQKIIN